MTRQIVILGAGSVGKCVLYYLTRMIRISYKNVTIVDCLEREQNFPAVKECLAAGATFLKWHIKSENVEELFDKLRIKAGDAIIDLTTRTPAMKIFAECRRRQVHLINTDIYDESKPSPKSKPNNSLDSSIRTTHAIVEDVYHKTEHHGPITHVLECGANPGLISCFVKRGLSDIAKWVLAQKRSGATPELKAALKAHDYRLMAKILDVQTIHCAETDTQVATKKAAGGKSATTATAAAAASPPVFLNTWSCVGLIDEGNEPCEIALGTHETTIPMAPHRVDVSYPQIALLAKDGIKVRARSYCPIRTKTGEIVFEEIHGRCVHHGESISLNLFLGRDTYAPSMHYVYSMNPATESQLQTMKRSDMLRVALDPTRWRVMNMHTDELEGADNLGACFLLDHNPATGEKKPWGWWCGSMLDTENTKNVLKDPYFGPTVIQVMAGVLSGLSWALKHPDRGLVFPEQVDPTFILGKSKKYLGTFFSGPVTCPIAGTTLPELLIGLNPRGKSTKLEKM